MCDVHLYDNELKEVLLATGNIISIPSEISSEKSSLENTISLIKDLLIKSGDIASNDFIASIA